MTFTPEITTINQRVQIGAESTAALGTIVPAGKLLDCFNFKIGIKPDVKLYGATGHKYDIIAEENMEWTEGSIDGPIDYNGILYPLASVMGSVAPVAHGASAVAKDWIFIPPTTGSIVPQTYSIQQGDSIRAHSFGYGIFTNFAYKFTRKEATCSGKFMGQLLSDAITLTPSPTAVALAPAASKSFNVFLDTTYAGLGVTQLLKVLSVDYAFDGVYTPAWFVNRATPSYASHVDAKPKTTMKLMLEADSFGMALLPIMKGGTSMYLRVDATGAVIDNNQTVSLGTPSAGNFTLTYKGQTTATIAYNATAAAVQSALLLLSSIPAASVTVSGSAGGPYTVAFLLTLATDTTALTGSGAGLTGGTFLITQSQVYNEFTHDMVVKTNNVSEYKDDQGIFAIEWEMAIAEDPTWNSGQAQKATVTSLLTAL